MYAVLIKLCDLGKLTYPICILTTNWQMLSDSTEDSKHFGVLASERGEVSPMLRCLQKCCWVSVSFSWWLKKTLSSPLPPPPSPPGCQKGTCRPTGGRADARGSECQLRNHSLCIRHYAGSLHSLPCSVLTSSISSILQIWKLRHWEGAKKKPDAESLGPKSPHWPPLPLSIQEVPIS